jgi:hypothetical protein
MIIAQTRAEDGGTKETSGKLTAMATVVAFHAHPDDEAILTG